MVYGFFNVLTHSSSIYFELRYVTYFGIGDPNFSSRTWNNKINS